MSSEIREWTKERGNWQQLRERKNQETYHKKGESFTRPIGVVSLLL